MSDAIAPDTDLRCNERFAAPPRHDQDAQYRYPAFRATVIERDGDYLAARVHWQNGHRKSPRAGAEVTLSVATVRDAPEWEVLGS